MLRNKSVSINYLVELYLEKIMININKIILYSFFILSVLSESYSIEKGIIIGDGVRLRDNPNGQIVTKLYKNNIVTILSKTEKTETINGHTSQWYKIKTEKDEEGWVFGYYLKINTANKPQLSSYSNLSNENYSSILKSILPSNFEKSKNN